MSACRTCGAPIIWAEHADTGKRMPLDEAEVTTGVRFVIGIPLGLAYAATGTTPGHESHFATCPDAKQHRRGPS